MDQATIFRYQAIGTDGVTPGDIYKTLAAQYGTAAADSIATAARTGDETAVNAALVQAKYGAPLDTSFWSNLGKQASDPSQAPLAWLEEMLKKLLTNIFSNPLVLLAIAAVLFLFFGGSNLIRKKLS